MPDHPHNVPAGVQRERSRLAEQLHIFKFMQQLISLAAIARVTARNQILPGRQSAARTWNNMIQSQFTCRQYDAAVLAAITIAQQNILP
jgi:hypothetical protein